MTTQAQLKNFSLKFWKFDLEVISDELWTCLVTYTLLFLSPLGFVVIDSTTVMVLLATVIIFSLMGAMGLYLLNEFLGQKREKFLIIRRPIQVELSRDHFAIASATALFSIDLLVLTSLPLTWITCVFSYAALVLNFRSLVILSRTFVQ